jgi:molybdopterin-containing oxidoreductase family iron-sulfur binding subunit
MKTKKIYWKNIDQLDSNNHEIKKIHENEFVSKLPVNQNNKDQLDNNHTRRDFLKYLGYSTAAATIAACEGPVIKSVPYVVQPEQIIPGIANSYAIPGMICSG